MEGRTHFAGGLFLWSLGGGPEALVGAMLPDIDSPRAVMGSPLVSFAYGHRGLFHSLSFLFILGGTALMLGLDGFAWGYGLHIALDSATRGGVAPLLPFGRRRLKGPLKTGDFFDKLICALFAASALATFLVGRSPLRAWN